MERPGTPRVCPRDERPQHSQPHRDRRRWGQLRARPRDRALAAVSLLGRPLAGSEIDEIVIDQLRQGGFEIGKPNDAAWVVPKPFKLSVA